MKKNLVAKLSMAINLVLATALVFFILTYSNNSLVADEDSTSHNEAITVCDLVVKDQQKTDIEAYTGEPAPVNFESNPDAKLFRTTITNQVEEGVNFAGHYTVATWGCGTSCRGYAIVDVITGNIVNFEPGNEFEPVNDFAYSRDTNILVLNPRTQNTDSMTIQEILEDGRAYYARVYYDLVESTDDTMPSLRKLCTENVYSGLLK